MPVMWFCRARAAGPSHPKFIERSYAGVKDLRFTIAWIRDRDAAFSFIHSDNEDNFYVDIGLFQVASIRHGNGQWQ